jgi:hypothetical protein
MEFISIKVIMDRLTRHPLLSDIQLETVVDYAVDFIRIVGTPPSFIEKTEPIEIKDYRGYLPCDFYQVIQVRTLPKAGNKFEYFRHSTDSFHMSPKKELHRGLTYKLQGNCIITSIRNGMIEIAYMALPVDEDGYPLIPDNSMYTRALELYIKLQFFTVLFDEGRISHVVYENTKSQYAWAVGQAQTDLIRPTIDQMEAISNMWNKFLPDATNDHQHGYLNEGSKEHIIIH